MMNLIMPLKIKSPIGRGGSRAGNRTKQGHDLCRIEQCRHGALRALRHRPATISACSPYYDGDFTNYIRDFIATIGEVFNEVVKLVEGGEKVTPCEKNVEAFISVGARARTCIRCRTPPTDFLRDQEALNGDRGRITRR